MACDLKLGWWWCLNIKLLLQTWHCSKSISLKLCTWGFFLRVDLSKNVFTLRVLFSLGRRAGHLLFQYSFFQLFGRIKTEKLRIMRCVRFHNGTITAWVQNNFILVECFPWHWGGGIKTEGSMLQWNQSNNNKLWWKQISFNDEKRFLYSHRSLENSVAAW